MTLEAPLDRSAALDAVAGGSLPNFRGAGS